MLIFDEATSHLDTATEQAIQKNLKTALAGKTVVLVAHRLSTIRDADFIYVLHQGRVAEQGTHRELIARNEHYAALCRAQSGADRIPHTHRLAGRFRSLGITPESDAPPNPVRTSQSIFDLQLEAN